MLNLNELEKNVLKFWDEDNTFVKSVENRSGRQSFVIYEGPPTANGRPGIHHVLTRTFKDMIARYQTMKGKFVERKAGWDEHGLPVEIEIQKELGLSTKKQIVEFGVKKFNEKCSVSTQKYIKDWEYLTHRMGYWLDLQNAYRTSNFGYIKKVWEVLKILFDKGLIYRSSKVVPWACDSETVVSNAEVAQGYKTVKHLSAYVLFKLRDSKGHLLAWTTTPWTLPANMALAVNPNATYKVCLVDGKRVVTLKEFGVVEGEVQGSQIVGREYYHPFTDQVLSVYAADFVNVSGTGVVHVAPAFGQDDYNLWLTTTRLNLVPIVCHVNEDGSFNSPEWLKGQNVLANNFSIANNKVLDYLKSRDAIFRVEEYEHEYPHNWRTGKPLIYFLRPSWYVNVNEVRSKMVAANDNVTWFPDHVKHGRFGAWLNGDVDWAISRERFWGTPLPFYGDKVTFPNYPHKPEADEGGRTPEVLDCWFDSGAMPLAAFQEYKQADVICEAIDQTRGWFYSLLVIGTVVNGEAPYKNVVCLGHVLDAEGNKMSKTKGNVVDPLKLFESCGADAVRWYMVSNPVGNSIVFKEDAVKNVVKNFINRFWNCYTFYKTYAAIENPKLQKLETVSKVIDQWIVARLEMTVRSTGICYDEYRFSEVTEVVEKFVDDLSNVWIRANRSRFWNTEGNGVDETAFYVLHTALNTLCRIVAPIMPFFSEHVWLDLEKKTSVHVEDYPVGRDLTLDESNLVDEMDKAKKVVTIGHCCRDEAGIKVRQALNRVYVPKNLKCVNFTDYLKEELNVKEISWVDQETVTLDTQLTEELLAEGLSREFVRVVQSLRKRTKLNVTDRIVLFVDYRSKQSEERLKLYKNEMSKKLLVSSWHGNEIDNLETFKVGDVEMGIKIQKD